MKKQLIYFFSALTILTGSAAQTDKSLPAKTDVMKDVISQWYKQVVKRLSKADKKRGSIYTQHMWDGWASTVAIGNFYQSKKKCVVMLSSFRKGKTTACVVIKMSEKSFKQPIEFFSKTYT